MKDKLVTSEINQRLVDFQTAKLANEKGFNVIEKFDNVSLLYRNTGEAIFFHDYDTISNEIVSLKYISCPTQSLLQKWLRGKGIVITIVAHYDSMLGYLRGYIANVNGKCYYKDNDYFEDYEDAMDIGLINGLKLLN